jgi:hypothetical protein
MTKRSRLQRYEHFRYVYNIAALFFFFLFLDNLLRPEEGQGWGGFWPCSGKLDVLVLYFRVEPVGRLCILVTDCQRAATA